MPQRTSFTTISPLPASIRRTQAVAFLQDHLNMIDLNPLVKRRTPIDPPDHCPADERQCTWYSITDSISYLPGGLYDGEVNYTAAFHDLPGLGMQSHSYAAMGVEIQGKWTVGGNEPGEEPEPRELGSEAPREGLYLREECEVKCNMMMTRFIKKTILKSHGKLMASLIDKAADYPAAAPPPSTAAVPSTNGALRGRRQQRPSNVQPGRHGAGAGRSASPSLPSPTEPSAHHTRAISDSWGNMAASAQRTQQQGGRRPFATSSDAYLDEQQQRYARNQRPYAGGTGTSSDMYLSLRNQRQQSQPERPYLSSDVYLREQSPYGGGATVAGAQSTPGLHLYSNGPQQGGYMDGGSTAAPQHEQRMHHHPPAYSPGPGRQKEFAELA